MHVHDFVWVERPADQSRVLDWHLDCLHCGFSREDPAWRVLVTGSRFHEDRFLIWNALSDELAYAESLSLPMVVVEGQCPKGGADKIAEDWAEAARSTRRDVIHDPIPANWEVLGKRAGPYRNQVMVDIGANVCVSFPLPGSTGTYDCMRRAKEAGIHVKEF